MAYIYIINEYIYIYDIYICVYYAVYAMCRKFTPAADLQQEETSAALQGLFPAPLQAWGCWNEDGRPVF